MLPTASELLRAESRDWASTFGGFSYLKRVPGTIPYWDSINSDFMTIIRQIGKPTLFLTLNPPRPVEWPEFFVQSDARRFPSVEAVRNSSSDALSSFISTHPCEWTLYFMSRLHGVLRLLRSDESPIGRVTDYTVCLEEQARGYLHAHTILWVEGAPDLATETGRQQFPHWYSGANSTVHATVQVPVRSTVSPPVCNLLLSCMRCTMLITVVSVWLVQVDRNESVNYEETQMPYDSSNALNNNETAAASANTSTNDSAPVIPHHIDWAYEDEMAALGLPTARLVWSTQRHLCRPWHCGLRRCRYSFPKRMCRETRITRDPMRHRYWYLMERSYRERYINTYVPALLALWRGNMDLQPIGTGTSRCRLLLARP